MPFYSFNPCLESVGNDLFNLLSRFPLNEYGQLLTVKIIEITKIVALLINLTILNALYIQNI